uniref:Carbohydrate esterase family 1 protein n=1 Tax=termite gut metagenome TaxID=433724 RepID=S0DEE8_9ZZZZ
MKKLIFAAIALTCYALSASAQFNMPPMGRVEKHTMESKVLGVERDYSVYLPKSFDTDKDKKYPILYLLHGMLDTHNGWPDRGHVGDVANQLTDSGEMVEMIIVTPDAGGNIWEGAWNGYFDMPGWKYETFFFTEFMPYIEARYRVIGDKEHRAVAGLSMGGGGATSYGQQHWDKFSSVYAMSALMDINEANGVPAREPENPDDKMALLTRSVKEHSCIGYVEDADDNRVEQLRSVKWFIDCGDDDFLLDVNIDLTRAMRGKAIPFEFRIRDGGHTFEYWHSALYICLPYVSRNFSK